MASPKATGPSSADLTGGKDAADLGDSRNLISSHGISPREVQAVLRVGFGSWGGGLEFLGCREQAGGAKGPEVIIVTWINAD